MERMLERETWLMPDEWWVEVPIWLHALDEHLKAPWVGGFSLPSLGKSGWVYDVWEIGGIRSRWRVTEGKITPAGRVRKDKYSNLEDWWWMEGEKEVSEKDQKSLLASIVLTPPKQWKLGNWGWVTEGFSCP